MKTSEIIFIDIDNEEGVDKWYDLISKERTMDSATKEDWLGCHILEIYYKGNHVGYIAYRRYGGNYCLACIYVLAEYRHQGIATAAIRKLNYMLNDFGTWLFGFVHKENLNAILLYIKLGFKFLNKERTLYSCGIATSDTCDLTEDGFYEFGKRL